MGSTLPALKCALCDQPIHALGDLFRASGTFLPPGDPLARYSEAPLHWDCYAKWSERPRFARMFVDAWVKANRKNPFWWDVYRDDRVYVSVNPQRPVEEVSVRLYATGNDIRVPLARWKAWLANVDQVTPGLRALTKEALMEVLPLLRERFPDDHAVVNAIRPDEKRA